METRDQRMLVIGAGPVGLATAKAFKEAGIPYDQVEADDGVGGNWRHGVYETAHIISSKKTTEFDDWPMPAQWPDFPSGAQMATYYESYAQAFKLHDHLELKTQVLWVAPLKDGRWAVTLMSPEGRLTRRYKGVAVCTGHHWCRRFPEVPGSVEAQKEGRMLHSKDYKSPEQLRGKRILTIGGGNSACDVAAEAGRVAAQSHLSLRRGYWFMPKTFFGVPTVELIKPWMPLKLQRALLRALLKISVGSYSDYGLPEPDHDIFEAHPTINSELLHYIKHGKVSPHPDVAKIEGERVFFVDGSHVDVDLIVAGTGYHLSFPFLPEGVVPIEGPVAKVYSGSMLLDYKHLYIVGTGQVRYGLGPLVAPYARLLARIIPLQDSFDLPMAQVLRALGDSPPTTHLVDPYVAIHTMKAANAALPALGVIGALVSRFKGPWSPQVEGLSPGPGA